MICIYKKRRHIFFGYWVWVMRKTGLKDCGLWEPLIDKSPLGIGQSHGHNGSSRILGVLLGLFGWYIKGSRELCLYYYWTGFSATVYHIKEDGKGI